MRKIATRSAFRAFDEYRKKRKPHLFRNPFGRIKGRGFLLFLPENRGTAWDGFFLSQKETLKEIDARLFARSERETVFPQRENVFEALKLCRPQDVSAVILGQDPYHGAGEATGLAFAVEQGVKLPPSLKNIFKELKNDLETDFSPRSDLKDWAAQGVLLLNSFLTVAKDSPGSHKELGWEKFTDGIISYLSAFKRPKVFVLWGNFAQSKRRLIDESENLVISSPHPSPLSASRGFFGSKPFSRTNAFLRENGQKQVMWVRDF